ncbi:hypothetical protein [uncultured Mucilaginibacter sp.]|uniref:hypothetical protein n=1 Tax=uncultured Mucilaginibacter sp. TaxID=797541 RepID=UPI0025EA1AD5|nr:hypothetical protein [uncultured Mucilaginibacter sp.]
MQVFETYLQTAWGGSWENITIEDVNNAIDEMMKMDDEHGAFWVGLFKTGENVLEMSKDLTLIGVFEDDSESQIIRKGKNRDEAVDLYQLLLSGDIDALKIAFSK